MPVLAKRPLRLWLGPATPKRMEGSCLARGAPELGAIAARQASVWLQAVCRPSADDLVPSGKAQRKAELLELTAAASAAAASAAADEERVSLQATAEFLPYRLAGSTAAAVVQAFHQDGVRKDEKLAACIASDALKKSKASMAAARQEEDRIQRDQAAASTCIVQRVENTVMAGAQEDAFCQALAARHGAIHHERSEVREAARVEASNVALSMLASFAGVVTHRAVLEIGLERQEARSRVLVQWLEAANADAQQLALAAAQQLAQQSKQHRAQLAQQVNNMPSPLLSHLLHCLFSPPPSLIPLSITPTTAFRWNFPSYSNLESSMRSVRVLTSISCCHLLCAGRAVRRLGGQERRPPF